MTSIKVAFYGEQTAGVIVLLTLLAKKIDLRFVIAEDEKVQQVVKIFNLKLEPKKLLDDEHYIKVLKNEIDFFIRCHGKKILSDNLVNNLRCINLHPCLYKYKDAKPIKRLILDKNSKASVASHWMTDKVDGEEVIVEKFMKIADIQNKTEADVYGEFYHLYVEIVNKTLNKVYGNI